MQEHPTKEIYASNDVASVQRHLLFLQCTSFSGVTNDIFKIMAQKDNLDFNLHKDKSYFLPAIH